MNCKIVVTSNTDTLKLKKEFLQKEDVTVLELFLEVEVGKEEEMFTTINSHLQQLYALKELSFTFKKYSVFNHFQIITKGLSYLKRLEQLSFIIKENSFFTDSNLIELTDSILGVPQLTDLTILIASGSSIRDTSLSYITQCIQQLPNLSKLNIQLEDTCSYKDQSLSKLGESIKSCTKLKELILFADFQLPDQENISSFFHSISTLTSLEKFEMRMNLTYGIPFIIDQLMVSISNLIKLRHLKLDPIFLLEKEYTLPFVQINLIRNCIEQLRSLEVLMLKGGIDICTSFGMKTSSTLSQLKVFESSIRMNGNSKQSNGDDQVITQIQQFSQFKNLEKLNLTLNSNDQQGQFFLQNLANGFESMINLKELKIKQCNFKTIKSERILFFRQLKHLTNLRKFKLEVDETFYIDEYLIDLLGTSLMHLKSLKVLQIKIKTQILKPLMDLSNFMISILSLTGLEQLSIDYDKTEFSHQKYFNIFNETLQMKFFKEISAFVSLKELNLIMAIPITKLFSEILRDSLLNLVSLETVQLQIDSCTFCDLSRIMEGLKSEQLKFLEIDLFYLKYENGCSEASLFDCSPTLTELCLKIRRIDHEAQELLSCLHKPIFQNLKKLKELENLKLSLSVCIESGVSDLRNFLYSSPQLLNISVTIDYVEIEHGKEVTTISQENEWIPHRVRKIEIDRVCIFQLKLFEHLYLMQNIKQIKIGTQYLEQNKQFTNLINSRYQPIPQYLAHLSVLHFDSDFKLDEIYFYMLLKQFQNLKSLQFYFKDDTYNLLKEEVFELGDSFAQLVSLETLNLKLQFFEENDERSLKQLSTGIKQLQNLKSLTLEPKLYNKKSIDKLPFIMDAFSSLVNLQFLNIDTQDYKCESISWLENLGASMSKLENLLSFTVKLYKNRFEDALSIERGIESIGNSLKYLKYLSNLDIQFTGNFKIEINGETSIFGRGISTLSRLTRIVLDFDESCGISQEGAVQIIEGLSNLQNLEHVELRILGQNNINSDLMRMLTQNLQQLRNLRVLKIDLLGKDHLTNPPFGIEKLISSHAELPKSKLSLGIDGNKFSSKLQCMPCSYQFNLQYSSILNQYRCSDVTLPTSILNCLKENCKLEILIENTNNLKSKSLDNLLGSIAQLQVKKVDLFLCMNENIEECLEIIEAVTKIKGLEYFNLTQYTNEFAHSEYIKLFEFVEKNLSHNLKSLTIRGDDRLFFTVRVLNQLAQRLCCFTNLQNLTFDIQFLVRYRQEQYLYRFFSRKLLKLVQLNISQNQFLSNRDDDDDEVQYDEDIQEGQVQDDENGQEEEYDEDIQEGLVQDDENGQEDDDKNEKEAVESDFSDEANQGQEKAENTDSKEDKVDTNKK